MTGDVATSVAADAEATLASVRAAAKTQMERALDDATRAATESWARERERWVAERAALESRAEALSALVADGEARNASLEEQLRDAERACALAAAETRKTRAELDDVRDEQEGRFQRLRAEVKVWEDACVKYRKRMEHAERALRRLKQRAGAAGFVEATQPEEDRAGAGVVSRAGRERRGGNEPILSPKPFAADADAEPPSPLALAPPPALAPVAARKKKRARDGSGPDAAIRAGPYARRERTARPEKPTEMSPRLPSESARLETYARPAAAEGWRRPRTSKARGFPVAGSSAAGESPDGLWGESPEEKKTRFCPDANVRESNGKKSVATFPPRADPRDVPDRELFALGGGRARRGDAVAAVPATTTTTKKPTPPRRAAENGTEKEKEKEIKRVEVVRGALAREKLPAFACEACEKFYAAAGRLPPEGKRGEACAHCPGPNRTNDWSRHRARWAPPPAPRGFWNLDLTPAPRSLSER